MDRYQGLEEMSEAEGYALLMEQRRWEADRFRDSTKGSEEC